MGLFNINPIKTLTVRLQWTAKCINQCHVFQVAVDTPCMVILLSFSAVELKASIFVSTGSIRWILWFSVRYAAAAAAAHKEIFGVNTLRGKQQQLGSPNLQDIFIGGGYASLGRKIASF